MGVEALIGLETELRNTCGDVVVESRFGRFPSLTALMTEGPGLLPPFDLLCSNGVRVGMRDSCAFVQSPLTLDGLALGERITALCRRHQLSEWSHFHYASWALWAVLALCTVVALALLAWVWPDGLPFAARAVLGGTALFVIVQAWLNEPEWLTQRVRFSGAQSMRKAKSFKTRVLLCEDMSDLMNTVRSSVPDAVPLMDRDWLGGSGGAKSSAIAAVTTPDRDTTIVADGNQLSLFSRKGARGSATARGLAADLTAFARGRRPVNAGSLRDRLSRWRQSPLALYGAHRMLLWLAYCEFVLLLASRDLPSAAGWLPGLALLFLIGAPEMVIDGRVWVRFQLERALTTLVDHGSRPTRPRRVPLPVLKAYKDDIPLFFEAVSQYSPSAEMSVDGRPVTDFTGLRMSGRTELVEVRGDAPWVLLRLSSHGNWLAYEDLGLTSEGLVLALREAVDRCRIRPLWLESTVRMAAATATTVAVVGWGISVSQLGMASALSVALFLTAVVTQAWAHANSWERRARAFRLVAGSRPDSSMRLRGLVDGFVVAMVSALVLWALAAFWNALGR